MKISFSPRQKISKILFVLHFDYNGDSPCRFWFDLNNSLTRWKKNQFLIFANCEIRKFPYENFRFFLGKIYQKFFLFCTLTTIVILQTEFGLIWTTPWPDE